MEIRLKRIPFDLELAKKITNNECKGRICTRKGEEVRIICFDAKTKYPIICLIEKLCGEEVIVMYMDNGHAIDISKHSSFDLHIEVPTYYRYYSNFVPQKWQPVLVRNLITDMWLARVATGERTEKGFGINSVAGEYKFFTECLPISKLTIKLLGTRMSYDELLEKTW